MQKSAPVKDWSVPVCITNEGARSRFYATFLYLASVNLTLSVTKRGLNEKQLRLLFLSSRLYSDVYRSFNLCKRQTSFRGDTAGSISPSSREKIWNFLISFLILSLTQIHTRISFARTVAVREREKNKKNEAVHL